MQHPQVSLPLLSPDHHLASYAQLRPTRMNGYRIEREERAGKLIVHNYGHGGAGVSLAPGSGKEAVRLAGAVGPEVAVMGSGVIGLYTCYYLLQAHPHCMVTIYADKIPSLGEKDNSKMITSQVAPGFWFPFHYGGQNDERNRRISRDSFEEYSLLAGRQEYRHVVKAVDVYEIADEQEIREQYSNYLPEEIRHTFRQIDILLNGKSIKARTLRSLKIDMQPFLHMLCTQLRQRGVVFKQQTFTAHNIASLPEPLVFNCTGLASKELFGDKELRGVKGHLVEYRNPAPERCNCIITANIGKQTVDYYMHESRILLGLTEEDVEDCQVQEGQVKMLQEAHRQVLAKFGLPTPRPAL